MIFLNWIIFVVSENITFYFRDAYGDNFQQELTKFIDETIPENFKKYEALVEKNGGFFVNGKLSWVDFYFAATVEYISWAIDWIGEPDKTEILANFPQLTKLNEKILSVEAIKKWICERPEETMTEFV